MTTEATRPPFTDQPSPGGDDRRRRWWWSAVAVLAAVAVAVWAVVLVRGGEDAVVGTSPSPAASAVPSASAAPQTPAASAPPSSVASAVPSAAPTAPPAPPVGAAVDRSTAVWPVAGSGTSYAGPVAAATGFATAFLGFEDPVVGPFLQGDSRSGEVAVRPTARGPVTTVLVRQLSGEQTWSVLGATTEGISVTEPTAGAVVAPPAEVRGSAWTFEGHVTVQVRQDGRDAPLGEGSVIGGGDAMRPFTGSVGFARPTARYGSLVFLTHSAEDGAVWQAAVVRVQLRPGTTATTPSGSMTVTVWYSVNEGRREMVLVPAQRVVPRTTGVLRATLTALLAGPTPDERAKGMTSWFSPDTAGMLREVTLTRGKAVVDFHDLRPVIPGASSSAGSQLLLDQLGRTVEQFPTVDAVEYRIEGSAPAFSEWLQLEGPDESG